MKSLYICERIPDILYPNTWVWTSVLIINYSCLYLFTITSVFLTIVSEASGGDDGDGDHDEAAAAPHVLHEELLDHDVPEALGQDQVHLLGQSTVALLQLTHLHLQRSRT